MHFSPFNVIIDLPQGEQALFNSMTGAILRFEKHVLNDICDCRIENLDLKTRLTLLAQRILVADKSAEIHDMAQHLRGYRNRADALRYTLVTTFACNLRCSYCYEDAIPSRYSPHPMSDEVADAFVERVGRDLADSGAKRIGITLYGGEPLMNLRPALRIFKELRRRHDADHVSVSGALITNGTLLTSKVLSELKPYIKYSQITLDGGPDHHDRIRIGASGRPTFTAILDSIELLLREGIRVAIRIQVTKNCLGSLDACFQRLRERGLTRSDNLQVYFFPIMDLFNVCSARSFECGHRYHDTDLYDSLLLYARKEGVLLAPPQMPVWITPYCSFLNHWSSIVTPDGSVYKCVAMVGQPEGVVGNVLTDTQTVEHGARQRQFEQRSGLDLEECRGCAFLPVCDGGCGFAASGTHVMDEKQSSCDFRRHTLKKQIQINALSMVRNQPGDTGSRLSC